MLACNRASADAGLTAAQAGPCRDPQTGQVAPRDGCTSMGACGARAHVRSTVMGLHRWLGVASLPQCARSSTRLSGQREGVACLQTVLQPACSSPRHDPCGKRLRRTRHARKQVIHSSDTSGASSLLSAWGRTPCDATCAKTREKKTGPVAVAVSSVPWLSLSCCSVRVYPNQDDLPVT